MTGQPATKSPELLNQINTLSAKDRDNAILLKRLKREASQVLATGEVASGYTLLGALAAMRGNAEETRSYHAKAVAAAPSDPAIFRNFAISLLRVGLIDEAISMADRSWRLDQSQNDNFNLLVQLTCHGGRIQEAVNLVHACNLTGLNSSRVAELEDAASLLAKNGVSDQIAGAIARAAIEVVAPISISGVDNRIATDDESTWVDFTFLVNDSTERVIELNRAFADRMAELTLDSEISRASSPFVVRFTRNVGLDAGIAH